jgi:hypothetical protein
MPSQEDCNEVVKVLLTLQLMNKMYHWQTTSHARHQATNGLDDSLGDLIDKFVEVYIGKNELKPNISSIKLELDYLNDDGMVTYLKMVRKYLESLNGKLGSSDLGNIRDEILSAINKTLYLFTQK